MVNKLVELSRNRQPAGGGVVMVDYDAHPAVCRSGVWVGWQDNFPESVVLSYKHSADRFAIGWSLNGTDVIDPGYSSGTGPYGYPVPNAPRRHLPLSRRRPLPPLGPGEHTGQR